MHLSEGILTLNQALVTSALALPFVYSGFAQHKKSVTSITPEERKPLATMVFALCFAVTLIPIPVPIIGASSHMCATPLLSLLFGPSIIAFPIFGVLLLHALFFAHGGISTLGANVLTLGVIGPWLTWIIFTLLAKIKINRSLSIGLSCFCGSIGVYFADTLILSFALSDKQYFWASFHSISLGFLPVQGPLSILEGLLSSTILIYLTKYGDTFIRGSFHKLLQDKVSKIKVPNYTLLSLILIYTAIGISDFSFSFQGIDDIVFTKTAEDLGINRWTILPEIEGELELFVFSLGFFIAGTLFGKSWEKIRLRQVREQK